MLFLPIGQEILIGKTLEDELGVEENSVQAETGVDENGNETFHYTEASALEGFSSDKLMQCIENGDIEVDIRLGLYASGKQKGKKHDNGTAFRGSEGKLGKCFREKRELI